MARVKLADEVRKKKTITVVERPELGASKCDGCGNVFKMGGVSEEHMGVLRGTFEGPDVYDDDGRRKGNGFSAHACSFKCAHELFADGGWKRLAEYKGQAKAGCKLARVELTITTQIKTEKEIRADWEKITYETNGVRSFVWRMG